jgi:hypothetical protein
MTDDYDFELAEARKKARYEDDYENSYKKDKSDDENAYDKFAARDFANNGLSMNLFYFMC